MAMVKVIGATLQTGVTASGVSGVHEQSSTASQGGELKIYKDKSGNDLSVYANDRHKEFSFEALIETTVTDKQIGETITVGGVTCCVTKWDVIETNDDVKKVSISCRSFPDIGA